MICPSCNMKNNYYHRYCFHCGRQLVNEDSSEKKPLSSGAANQLTEDEGDSPLTDEQQNPDSPLAEKQQDSDSPLAKEQQFPDSWTASMSWEEQAAADSTHILESNPEPELTAESAMQSESQLESQSESQSGSQSESQSEPQSGSQSDPQSGLHSESQPEPQSGSQSDPQSGLHSESRSDSQSESQPELNPQLDTDIFDDFFLNFSIKDDEEKEFDIQSQLPLRRYRKAEKNGDELQRVIKAFIAIILIALTGFLVYVGYVELIHNRANHQPVARIIDFEYRIEETELDDGQSARKIIVISSIGEQIKVKEEVAPVISGQGEIILPDKEFEPNNYDQLDGALQVTLPLTVLADGYPNRTEEIQFEVPIQTAPVTFLSPSEKEVLVEGDSYQLLLKVLPGSSVFVDGSNYSNLVDEEGQFSLQLEISDQPEIRYEIRVSTKGYGELVEQITFKKKQMEFPLTIDQKIPVQATQDGWVEITGNTHPEAVLSSNLETREDIQLDPVTGDFKLFVGATARGYTPFTLTAKLEGKEDSVLETVIQRQVNESDYTRSAWAMEYDNMQTHPNLHNGIPFVFTGNVTDIRSTGTRTTLLINVAAQDQPTKLVHVDFWGTLQISPGNGVRVFGNRWGNKDDNPYILAPYIYLENIN